MNQTIYERVEMDHDLPMKVLHFSSDQPELLNQVTKLGSGNNAISHVPMHWHRSLEISYLIKGQLTLRKNNQDKKYQDETFFVINSGEVHEMRGSLEGRFELICFIISYDFVAQILPNIDQMYFDMGKTEKTYSEIRRLFRTILALANQPTPFSNLRIQSELLELFYLLSTQHLLEDDHFQLPSHSSKKLNQEILDYVHQNYTEKMSLEEIANQFSFSREHFSRMFKTIFGQSFLNYLNEYRLYQAFPEIMSGEQTIEMISQKHGFPSTKALIKQFKKIYQDTPVQFRKKHAIKEA
ncbi:AraC family transcriptional regulator [Enterococcus alcedinis]|uniref:Transcriptional regulator n=1 Tax=Enterococcus alcedinis TaxID=1274384 RepID=A0A917N5X6_9ENTE|nr:AraC family transcriptional regulator [Enterococcus alcedinis]MBP2102952.1 AraC-like DNA-binding protein [Enterococcus alcedinis]GGI66574.1 transcriptional regulator [Enterococcus alcedinis]